MLDLSTPSQESSFQIDPPSGMALVKKSVREHLGGPILNTGSLGDHGALTPHAEGKSYSGHLSMTTAMTF